MTQNTIEALDTERDALQAQLAAAQRQEPIGFVESAVRGAGGFHACFSSGVFIPAGTQLFAAPIPQQVAESAPSSLPLLSEAFRTTESNGASSEYHMVFKFKDLASLHSADDEWRKFKGAA